MQNWSIARYVLFGLLTIVLGAGGFAVWALTTEINGAVVASGRVEVEARRQTLQHPDGGVVAAIDVRDGDTVKKGEPLIRLDGTELQAQEKLLQRQLYETLARLDRLTAEISDAKAPDYRPELTKAAAQNEEVARLLKSENALFTSRRDTMDQTLAQLAERQTETRAGIEGYDRQREARDRQLTLISQELKDQEELYAKGLTQSSKVSAIRREAADLEGEIGGLEASVAEAKSTLAGYEIERLRLGAQRREDAQDQLRTLQPKEVELRENLRVVRTKIGRLVLRAPMTGRVLDLRVHTIGGVITPGTDVISIVPLDTPLVLTVRIDPRQIDRVHAGQTALIRFPNFDSRTTPSFFAAMRTVSADTVTDQATGKAYFTGELTLTADSQKALSAYQLQPGMPIEAFIQTAPRTPASFILKPIADYLSYALREE